LPPRAALDRTWRQAYGTVPRERALLAWKGGLPTYASAGHGGGGGSAPGGHGCGGSGGGSAAQAKGGGSADAQGQELSDMIEFTTTIKASAGPKVQIKAVGSGFRLTDASASLSADRIDRHKVTITLTFPKPDETAADTAERAIRANTAMKNSSDLRAVG